MKVDAIILAGGKLKDSNKDKAFVQVGGRTLVDIMATTLDSSPSVGKIIVTSAPKEYKKQEQKVDEVVYDTGDLVDNIAGALAKVETKETLIVASDIPLLTPNHVEEFIEICSRVEAGVYYPFIPKSAMGKFSSMERTYLTLDKLEFTGGNLVIVKNEEFLKNLEMARKIYDYRKKPLKLISILGPGFLAKMAFGKLSISEVESKISELLRTTAKGIIVRHPEIGSDIDKQEDLEFIENIIGGSK